VGGLGQHAGHKNMQQSVSHSIRDTPPTLNRTLQIQLTRPDIDGQYTEHNQIPFMPATKRSGNNAAGVTRQAAADRFSMQLQY